MRGSVLVLIPTYGDSARIPDLVKEVVSLGDRYVPLVVDDGSPTPIPPIPRALHVRLAANFGLGVAMHVALDHAIASSYDYVVRIDSDGQHLVSDIPGVVLRLEDGADVVVGARGLHRRGSNARELLALGAKLYLAVLTRLVAGSNVPSDVTSGFQGFNHRAATFLSQIELERYPEPHVLIVSARAGLRIDSIQTKEQAREHGTSTLNFGRGLQAVYRFNILVLRELIQGTREK